MSNTSQPPPLSPPFALSPAQLSLPKEGTYLAFVITISVLAWLILALTIFGLFYAALFAFVLWLGNGLLTAHLRSEAVRVNERQLPELHATFSRVWEKLGGTGQLPHLYVVQSGGALNAFATRFSGRNFVVVYSDILEAFGPSSSEIQFILGHEIGHIKSNHIMKQVLLSPGIFTPLLGSAYLRACEASCDRYGAIRAMLTLSGGREQGRHLNAEAFACQHADERGFFVSWYELTSGYPTLSVRVAQLVNLARPGSVIESPGRNPFAYLFAFMTPGGRFAAGGNILVFAVVIGLLAAMAIPAFQKVRHAAEEQTCIMNRHQIAAAYEQASLTKGKAPENYSDFIGPGKSLAAMPICLSHGEYEVTAKADGSPLVTCSVHHAK